MAASFFIPKVFEDQEVHARELLDQRAAGAGRLGFGEVGGEIKRAPDEHAVPGTNDPDRDGGGDVRLPHARRPDQEDAGVGLHEAGTGKRGECRLGQFRIEAPVEVGERLDGDDARLFQSAGEEPVGPAHELVLDEQLEELEMGQGRGFGLSRAWAHGAG